VQCGDHEKIRQQFVATLKVLFQTNCLTS